MNKNFVRKAHRWLGLIFSLTILMSAGSGVIHNVMTRTQAPPPSARPSGQGLNVSQIQMGVAEATAKLPEAAQGVSAVNVRSIGGQPWYQVYLNASRSAQYVSAVDGRVDAAQDEAYAKEIASAFLGGAQVEKTDFLTAFNNEYINIFRILPVYRFDLKDELNTRVYVSTMTGSVTRHTDDGRQFEARIFTNFHKFGFIPNKDVRDFVLTTLTFATCVVSLSGIVLFFMTRPKKRQMP
ncbi:PepSY-associated transmembrane protein [Prosthecobacter fusiformis]|uniref:PepSY-associated transmembrane protein n=1 Tax=Prosthecobacter fusiformis TaxID=48464 RepID=A0A4R7S0U3_9BACT|nr:PepSY domain-containing protein [Prosthecobacter fusiformis]TDU71289.1 PepSY-associated transmembrane protein [Prosthecobacter fusiformis]